MHAPRPVTSLSVSPHSLATAFADVPDPRRHASVVYPLPAVLALAVAALLANHHSVLAIAERGACQSQDLCRRLSAFPAAAHPTNRRCIASPPSSTATPWPQRSLPTSPRWPAEPMARCRGWRLMAKRSGAAGSLPATAVRCMR